MSDQIIKQPDGLYAVWSTVVDDFVILDASPEEIIADRLMHEKEVIETRVKDIVKQLNTPGSRPYHQFTMTWEEACKLRDEVNARKKKRKP